MDASNDGSGTSKNKDSKASPLAETEDEEALADEPQILRAEPVQAMANTDEQPKKDKAERSLGYKGWMITEGGAYKTVRPGRTNYVGGGMRPFPLNPFFRPRPPVPDKVKEAIYADYLKAPERNTPRLLGEKYAISIKRVEAILKLKAIEHHMVEYGKLDAQKNLTAGMESMLGISPSNKSLTEGLVSQSTRVSGPRFHAVPEGQSFTAVDAAEVLGRKPYQQIMDRMAASKPFVIDYEGLDERFAPRPKTRLSKSEVARLESLGHAEDKVIDKDTALGSRRWKFVFTDISKAKEMKDRMVLIREPDGTLKKAGRDYKLKRYGQIWYH
ncbi:hypothetical protein LPJ53_000623 [Coemansia erecta]|uniref:Uncharacterized protein n=1 Tax=Coemansia erecta TaxID=147472 RepID=A0A9W8CT07_9FUNG|nr:hypothetical protein LPJ53_000623 [Coemansia erecta]